MSPALGVARVSSASLVGPGPHLALETLGVPVAPLLTTLGIGSLAVALALQDTLANFFAGLHLLADRPVRAGRLHQDPTTGEEGFVETIGWRSSRLRTTENNIVIVPNQKLSQAILTNFHLPVAPRRHDRRVTSRRRRADAVEPCLERRARRAPSASSPSCTAASRSSGWPTSPTSGQVWSCVFRSRDVEAQARAGHEVRKRLLARLRRERNRSAVR